MFRVFNALLPKRIVPNQGRKGRPLPLPLVKLWNCGSKPLKIKGKPDLMARKTRKRRGKVPPFSPFLIGNTYGMAVIRQERASTRGAKHV